MKQQNTFCDLQIHAAALHFSLLTLQEPMVMITIQ